MNKTRNGIGCSLLLILLLSAIQVAFPAQPGNIKSLCEQFNTLNTQVRDNTIDKGKAKEQFTHLLAEIKKNVNPKGADTNPKWVFPLKGYGKEAIGGVNGSGFVSKGYSYFDGNQHTGHPAHDIFIRDKDQDIADDRTKKPVDILSAGNGIVVAAEPSWEPSSALRGGIYVWIYDYTSERLLYYAHNSKLTVKVGDYVKPGQKIAEMGRTGLNAYKKRSPTHLHFTSLQLGKEGLPIAENTYPYLLKATFIP